MTKQNFDQLISGSVDAVLETMFFSALLGPAEAESGPAVLEARLAFHGRSSGTLAVRLSEPSARLLAAGFLGEDEETLTEAQLSQMVCELSNMVCGSLVSKLESEEHFDLDSPQFVAAGSTAAAVPDAPPAARQSFELENGILTVTLYLEAGHDGRREN
ncbi:MAG: chemotaxis protein CheX [Acidobacteriaceae bacterium]